MYLHPDKQHESRKDTLGYFKWQQMPIWAELRLRYLKKNLNPILPKITANFVLYFTQEWLLFRKDTSNPPCTLQLLGIPWEGSNGKMLAQHSGQGKLSTAHLLLHEFVVLQQFILFNLLTPKLFFEMSLYGKKSLNSRCI